MKIRSRLLVVAAVPAAALAATAAQARAGSADPMIVTALAVAGIAAALGLAVAVSKTITEPLRRLGEAADRASHLQALVEALRRPGGSAHDLALAPVGLPSDSEMGEVGIALDAFQAAAARLAVGQAALMNKSVADKGTIEVFVNLARRIQGLVDHQIEFLDALEAEEQDPDTLEELFRLDQLATRVRRNAESLLTLSGTTASRSWERPLAMADVIRAGMAEVEDIARIDLLLDDDAAIVGNVAADAAHLLSELLENATRWSPPDTRVEVTGMPAAGGYAISIVDAGVGMPADALAEANHILTGPPLAETTVARSLGLVVAGRLARRLGVTVRLAAAATGGVIAKVLLPAELLVAAEDAVLETAGPARTLPFALARQEKRSRISSQRSRGPRRTVDVTPGQDATITRLPTASWEEPPAPPEVPAPTGTGWNDGWAPAEEPVELDRWSPDTRDEAPAVEEEQAWETSAWAAEPEAQPPAEAGWDIPAPRLAVGGSDWTPAVESGTDWDSRPAVDAGTDWDAPAVDAGTDWDAPATNGSATKSTVDPGTAWDAPAAEPTVEPAAAWDAPAANGSAPKPVVDPGTPWDLDPPAGRHAKRSEPAAPAPAGWDAEPPGRHAAPPAAAVEQPAAAAPPAAPAPPVPAEIELPVLRARPPANGSNALPQRPVPPGRRPLPAPAPEPEPAPPAAEAPGPRPVPTVRPARFAAASSRPLAGDVPAPEPVAANPKEEEFRRHLERATAAGLVRRVPKASLPKDTGTAGRAVRTPEEQTTEQRLPDQVRNLLSSYRAGVQRGRADEPADDDHSTSRSSSHE
ncbi:MAG TPA: ATP-binding protein [Acidimicrobiales bacterium]|nr:ATP-binding protein [Acidimicrobiales bacterium]